MNSNRAASKSIENAIRTVLVEDWDPIGVMDDPEWPRDEYDSYIGEIYGFLARGESAEFIAHHLCFIEDRTMGRRPLPGAVRLPVAVKLKSIDLQLGQE